MHHIVLACVAKRIGIGDHRITVVGNTFMPASIATVTDRLHALDEIHGWRLIAYHVRDHVCASQGNHGRGDQQQITPVLAGHWHAAKFDAQ